nr:unnamed protein product [Callosobruchus analis]
MPKVMETAINTQLLKYLDNTNIIHDRQYDFRKHTPTGLVRSGLESPGGIALDWIHDLIFWTDSGTRRIEVATLDGKHRSIIAASEVDKPRAIAVHPGEALVFWTDYGPNPKIEKAEMDGSNRKSIIMESVFWPNGIKDERKNSQKPPTRAIQHVCSFADILLMSYMRLPSQETVRWRHQHANKIIEWGLSQPLREAVHKKKLLLFYKAHIRPSLEYCSHLWGYAPKRSLKLLISIQRRAVKLVDASNLTKDLHRLENRRRVATLFLFYRFYHGRCSFSPAGIAFDWATEKIYWTDSDSHRIEVANTDGSMRCLLVWEELQKPRDITVDPQAGLMFWSEWGEVPKIERSNMDGSNRQVIVSVNLTWPNGLAVDHSTNKIYWTDGGLRTIEYANIDGSNRKVLLGK